jgi:hypothetical protein
MVRVGEAAQTFAKPVSLPALEVDARDALVRELLDGSSLLGGEPRKELQRRAIENGTAQTTYSEDAE